MTSAESPDAPCPPELASETIAVLYERQGLPEKAAAVRALLRAAQVEVAVDGSLLHVSWTARAPGPYVLRVVRFAAMDRVIEDVPVHGGGGTANWTGPRGWICVALGRAVEGQGFVSLAHAPPVQFDGDGAKR